METLHRLIRAESPSEAIEIILPQLPVFFMLACWVLTVLIYVVPAIIENRPEPELWLKFENWVFSNFR